jgi:DNA-binding MarR family transcriptional regulator
MAEFMGVLERRLKSRPITNVVQRGVINIQVAFAHFEEDFERVVGREQLSTSAFNLLRILRGQPDGHPRGEIAKRMVYRNSDVTRVIDVLVRRGLVERVRSGSDRRLSVAKITAKGLKTLARLDALVDVLMEEYDGKLTRKEWTELSRLLEAVYAAHVE